jgi:predicted regulator of Ras-like GTPase activity (Roadblock/LC7/MglB family)
MQDVLVQLNTVGGVRGSAVTTADGIVVAEALQGRYSPETVVGLTSFLISTTRRAMGNDTPLSRFVMYSTHGRLVIVNIGDAYLIVITDQFVKMEPLLREVDDSANRLRRATTIDV